MKSFLGPLLCAWLSFTLAWGQTPFQAVITDAQTKQPLAGASVAIAGTSLGAVADSVGRIILPAVADGRRVLVFSYVGYQTRRDTINFPFSSADPLTVQLSPEGEELEEVIISSTRNNRTIDDNPTRIEAITGEELEEKANMRPGDIRMQLNESTGIQVQQTSPVSANANIRIQGLDGRYTQILQDGLPLYAGFSAGLSILQIPPLNLRQIEVIKGSASTLYGGGAIAGLVNLITRQPTGERQLNFMANGTTAGGLDLSGFYAQKGDKVGVTVFAARNSQAAYDPGNTGFAALPRYERYTINPKLFVYVNPTATLSVGLNANTENRIGGAMAVLRDESTGYFERNRSERISSQLRYDKRYERDNLTIKNSVNYFNRTITQPGYQFGGQQWASFTEVSYSLNRKATEWIGGLNLWTDHFTENGVLPSARRNYQYSTVGAFVQNTWRTSDKVQVETGLRLDGHNRFGLFVLPRLSVLFKPTDKLTSRIGGGLGYQAPTIFTEDAESIGFRNVRPIDPATAQAETSAGANWDVNYRTELAEGLTLSVNQLFFYTRLNRALVLLPGSGTANSYQFVNADGPVDSRGLETNVRLGYEDFALYAGYSLVDTKRQYNGLNSPIPLTAKHRVNLVAVYELEGKFRVGLEAYYIGRKPLTDGNVSRSYWLMGVMAERRWKAFSIFINFENILNIRQTRYESVVLPPYSNPTFRDVWAPLEGFVGNGGIKLNL
ncbi:TonB-dependent receptor [Spirosoma fluminis]